MMDRRTRLVRTGKATGTVVYWMGRDQRTRDNWALATTQRMVGESHSPLRVVFSLVDDYLGAQEEHFRFMLEGLRQVERDLRSKGIPFDLVRGDPSTSIPRYLSSHDTGVLVWDFDPLRARKPWREKVLLETEASCYEVDSHNIVPCWVASPKQEYAAATFRPKIKGLLSEFLPHLPPPLKVQSDMDIPDPIDWSKLIRSRTKVNHPPSIRAGEGAAMRCLRTFIDDGLKGYDVARNDPNAAGQSGLSPYLHFGMISAQRVALEVQGSSVAEADKEAFLEELVVRRELSDNFCHYNQRYDSTAAFPSWAKITLREHLTDRREYLYSLEDLEHANTHDPLWNAAQREMLLTGKMHGYMRMYWAKKILEWSETPESAMRAAISLNDRFELDGRDPNGYTGIAWSIGGVHDRAWPQRPIFGKVRYMSYGGARSKFDVDRYISRFTVNARSGR